MKHVFQRFLLLFFLLAVSSKAYSAANVCAELLEGKDVKPQKPYDFYLVKLPRQPKFDIAEYVKSKGILTPKRFSGLKQALDSNREFIIRSEHPHEYFGGAGLLDSFVVTKKSVSIAKQLFQDNGFDEEEIRQSLLDPVLAGLAEVFTFGESQESFEKGLARMSYSKVRHYVELLGGDVEKFMKDVTYSYWEKLGGFNHSIIGDSAVSGRYHIYTSYKDKGIELNNYSIVENGEVIFSAPNSLKLTQQALFPKLVNQYEKIQGLWRFDPRHKPVIEMQSVDNQLYFLQYHRARNFEPAQFNLDRPLEDGEYKATFVRGATPPEGLVVETTIYPLFSDKLRVKEEAGAIELHQNHWFKEIMSRVREVQFVIEDLNSLASNSASDPHAQISLMFNPKVTIGMDKKTIEEILDRFPQLGISTKPQTIKINVISDGSKAYFKFLQ